MPTFTSAESHDGRFVQSAGMRASPDPLERSRHVEPAGEGEASPTAAAEPILCQHCGRTASNGISCQGYCVADSGY